MHGLAGGGGLVLFTPGLGTSRWLCIHQRLQGHQPRLPPLLFRDHIERLQVRMGMKDCAPPEPGPHLKN